MMCVCVGLTGPHFVLGIPSGAGLLATERGL